MRIIIAGGGIGGLTAALCCLHHTVFERASELGEVGAGIQLPPNAMKVFQALGIDEEIAKNAFQPEALEARMGETGRPIFTIPLTEQSMFRWGAPYLHIHRADYIEALSQALAARAPDALGLGAGVKTYVQDEDGATIILEDGRQFTGDVLVGADGIHSKIRESMLGPDKAVFTGNIAWRAVVPVRILDDYPPNPTACIWMGQGRHGVTYRLRRGELANFVGIVEREDWTKESWTEPGVREEALADFAGWHPTITNLITMARAGALYRWALFDRSPLARWVDGRVALLGDAAHPMLPFMAQGAAMAVEDAWVLARELTRYERPVAEALKAYKDIRYDRASRAQAVSRANMKTFHRRTRPSQVATYGPMWLAGKVAPAIIQKRLDWLYHHDVTRL